MAVQNSDEAYFANARPKEPVVRGAPDPDGAGPLAAPETTFEYCRCGNLTAQTDPLGRVTRWRYDERDRMIEQIDPEGGSTRHEYGDGISMIVMGFQQASARLASIRA